jgi:hypothetical protein
MNSMGFFGGGITLAMTCFPFMQMKELGRMHLIGKAVVANRE